MSADIVDDIHIVAGPALQCVSAGAPVERVTGAIAGQRVVQRIADRPDIVGTRQHQIFDIIGQSKTEIGGDRIGALAREFGYRIERAVDGIGIVARTAGHRVVAGAAVNRVVPCAAG